VNKDISIDFPSLKYLEVTNIHMDATNKFGVTFYLPRLSFKIPFTTTDRLNKFIG